MDGAANYGPRLEHADETDLGTEMLGIGGDRGQRFTRRLEQDGVYRRFVLEGDFGGWCRQREDNVKYATGSNSAWRSVSHAKRAGPWHFGQWRLRQEL